MHRGPNFFDHDILDFDISVGYSSSLHIDEGIDKLKANFDFEFLITHEGLNILIHKLIEITVT